MYASHPARLKAGGSSSEAGCSPRSTAIDAYVARIGGTPLLKLARLARGLTGIELWAKGEFLNPSGSVKDRAAWAMVRDGLSRGELGSGRTLLDASSGNTAIAYAHLGARLGFPVELCLPKTVPAERLDRLYSLGARVVLTDPLEGTDGAQAEAERRARESPADYYYPDQYRNPWNPRAHYETTGPEIWAQTSGRVTHWIAGVGTGGTLTGTGTYLRERSPGVAIVGVEPDRPLHGIEGLKHLPTARVPSVYDASLVTRTVRVSTEEAIEMQGRLARDEGLLVGRSSGAAVAGALQLARSLAHGVVVTVLADRGDR
jgi:cysteine synthase B